MWTTLSAGRWICLLTLAVVMLCSASEADSFVSLGLPCFHVNFSRKIKTINECYEQEPRVGCWHHCFVIKNGRGRWCISPNATWLKDKREKGEIKCPPEFSKNRRFEVLDEDDVE